MSFTETQLIHRHIESSKLISPNEAEDDGLVMKIDRKLGRPVGSGGMAVRASVSSNRMCNPASAFGLSGWILPALSCLQYAHVSCAKFLSNVSEIIEKNAATVLLPYFLYTSLLVLAVQSAVIVTLLAQAYLPLGLWFLLGCTFVLTAIFYYTGVVSSALTYPSKLSTS